MMDIEKAKQKLDEIHFKESRRDTFLQHLDNQEQRLSRIAELLEVSPDEAEELIDLILEYAVSKGLLRSNVTKLKKRIRGPI